MDLYDYMHGLMISYFFRFIHYWNKYVILMHDIDKIIIDITYK